MARKKTWREKMAQDTGRKVEETPKGRMLVPTPAEVAEQMRVPSRGEVITTDAIRAALAARHGADYACPMCVGIFARIAAMAAEEERDVSGQPSVPWWRTLKPDGSLPDRFPGAFDLQADLLRDEGHTIDRSRKVPRVGPAQK